MSRFGLGIVAGVVPVYRLLRYCIVFAILATVLFWLDLAMSLSLAGLVLMGLALGPIFPSLIATTPSRVGEAHTPNTIGFQITATAIGGGILPALVGLLASRLNLEVISFSLIIGTVTLLVLFEALVPRRAT